MTKAKNEVSLKMKTNPRPPPPSPRVPSLLLKRRIYPVKPKHRHVLTGYWGMLLKENNVWTALEPWFNICSCMLTDVWSLINFKWSRGGHLHHNMTCFVLRVREFVHVTYAWLVSCVRGHARTFPFRLDGKTYKSDLS